MTSENSTGKIEITGFWLKTLNFYPNPDVRVRGVPTVKLLVLKPFFSMGLMTDSISVTGHSRRLTQSLLGMTFTPEDHMSK